MQQGATLDDGALFAVVDLETTGLSPITGDRIIEIAVLRLRPDGTMANAYTTLVNPLSDIGEPRVHGITEEDIESAPTFHEIVGDVLARLHNVVFVAHNAKFDRDFLGAELASEGVFLPALPSICTLQLSYRLHPSLANHRLATCCEAAGVHEAPFHCALEDARVTARLLVSYIREAGQAGMGVDALLHSGELTFAQSWPSLPPCGRVVTRTARSVGRLDPPYIARLVADLRSLALDEESAPYVDLLDRALEDRRITEDEARALEHTAATWGLSRDRVLGLHHSYVEALVIAAWSDGVITANEKHDLGDVARLLQVPATTLAAFFARHQPG